MLHDLLVEVTLPRLDCLELFTHDFRAGCRPDAWLNHEKWLRGRYAGEFSIEPISEVQCECESMIRPGINIDVREDGFEGHRGLPPS
ncbi:hypothetical protein ACC786_35555 [Rhizobium ruizarguesonis]|uniref:hypothetical protein n=1 Tax=Rhizobium ruizarguesonis TaxID=2081791 RepID=UPI001FE1D07B|nr:hypothetical protein [Rhizobium ruizarguesonis]